MKKSKEITQEELDGFVEEFNNDPNVKCKLHSIELITITQRPKPIEPIKDIE